MSNSHFNGICKEEGIRKEMWKKTNTETNDRGFAGFRDLLLRS